MLAAVALAALWSFRPLAPVPNPDTSKMESQVAEKIRQAREEVIRHGRSAAEWGKLGMIFQAHDLFREAEQSYQVAERLDAGDFRWPYLRARCLKQVQELDAALDEVRAASARDPSYAPLHVLEAELQDQSGRGDEAMASYGKALDVDPNLAVAELGIGRLALDGGDIEKALPHLEKAASLQPDSGAIQATLARAYQRAGNRDKARAAADLARALPTEVILDDRVMASVQEEAVSLVGYQTRANEAEARGEPKKAESLLRRMIELKPDDANLHYNLANNLSRQGRLDEAEASYREALRLEPKLVAALINLGIVLSQKGKLGEAKGLFEKALEIDPDSAGALSSLAKMAALDGDFPRAIALFQQALARNPLEVETHYALAQVYRHQGSLAEAVRSFTRALELAPDRADIHFDLAVTYARLGEFASAWQHVQRARAIGLEPPADFLAALRARMPEPPGSGTSDPINRSR